VANYTDCRPVRYLVVDTEISGDVE